MILNIIGKNFLKNEQINVLNTPEEGEGQAGNFSQLHKQIKSINS